MKKSEYQYSIILKIKKLRDKKNVSQAGLSELLDISRGHIANIENPQYPHKYTLLQLKKICDTFNYPISSLFIEDTDNESIDQIITKIIQYEQ